MTQIDYSLTPEERLQTYLNSSHEALELHCTMCIFDCLETCNFIFLKNNIIPILKKLLMSKFIHVAQNMNLNIPSLVELMITRFPNQSIFIIIGDILPFLSSQIEYFSSRFGEDFSSTYAALLLVLDKFSFQQTQIKILHSFAESKSKEVRFSLSNILIELAQESMPPIDFTTLMGFIIKLSSDLTSFVRETVPRLIISYMRFITNRQHKAMLSARYLLFCRDISSSVRKEAIECLVTLSEYLDESERRINIIYLAKSFLNDSDLEVKELIYSKIGQIISSLGSYVDPLLIGSYANILLSDNSEIAYSAAFSFPAVALALGKERWPELKIPFHSLIKSPSDKIRRTLSFGLESFAYLMEPNECQKVAVLFLNDISRISIGILSNLNQIIRYVADPQSLLFCLEEGYLKCCSEWRNRLQISMQLRYCADFYDHDILFQTAFALVKDQNATVRKDAISSFSYLFTVDKIPSLKELALSANHWYRSSAAQIFSFADDSILIDHVNILDSLCQDPCINVRISAVNSAISFVQRNPSIISHLKESLIKLKGDPDLDIQSAFSNIC